MIEMIWIWLAVVAVSLILEFITTDLTSIWFAISGLVSLILSAIKGVTWEVQLIVFILLSAFLLIFVRKITRKMLLYGQDKNPKTNLDTLIGKHTKLLTPITNETKGTISVNDIIWHVVGNDGEQIEKGQVVEVVAMQGNKLVVRKIENISGKHNVNSQEGESKMQTISNDIQITQENNIKGEKKEN